MKPPAYIHGPLLLGADGLKLSKQNHAAPLDGHEAAAALCRCLGGLQLSPPADLAHASPAQVLAWGLEHWPR